MSLRISIWLIVAASTLVGHRLKAEILTFEGLLGQSNRFDNGGPNSNSNGFPLGSVFLPNDYDATFDSWIGWSISSVQDSTTPGFQNQYAAFPGTGGQSSSTYGVAFGDTFINFRQSTTLHSLEIANTTYSALAMLQGDAFSKKFGGDSGTDPDYFKVTLRGHTAENGNGMVTGQLETYLADFRFDSSLDDYVLDDWMLLDLGSLGSVRSLSIEFHSSDTGAFGINTPTYLAMDNLVFSAVPEPGGWWMLGMGLLVALIGKRWGFADRKTIVPSALECDGLVRREGRPSKVLTIR